MKKFLICVSFALMLSACGSDHIMRFNLNPQQTEANPPVEVKPSYEGRSHFFLWGMWQKTDYNMANACSNRGIKAIEAHWTFYDSLMGGLSMGIYAPESFSIYCN